jgi:septal ring factor EnvC (AmiA/AmiB activator)
LRTGEPFLRMDGEPHGRELSYRGVVAGLAVMSESAPAELAGLVSDLLVDPERIRSGMERLIEQERATQVGDPEREAEAWARKIAECDRRRCAYQDQQAAGLMTLEELAARLKELESARTSTERELAALNDRQRRVEELEEDRDALLESLAGTLPEALDDLTGEERCRIYQMLRLEVMPVPQGGYEVSGALCTVAAPSG